MKIFNTIACTVAVAMATLSCSDITETQKDFLDKGEANYVGILDSVRVHGGLGRVEIRGKKTFLRNVEKFRVEWSNLEGDLFEKEFPIGEVEKGDNIALPISDLVEGDYTFNIYSIDQWGNSSLAVEAPGTSYGEIYKKRQSKSSILKFRNREEGGHILTVSTSNNTIDCKLEYTSKSGEVKEVVITDFSQDIFLNDWEDREGSQFHLTTRILPKEKLGLDTLTLDPLEQTARISYELVDIPGRELNWIKLTEHDADGTDAGQRGRNALFDDDQWQQFWIEGKRVPCHFCIDMGRPRSLRKITVRGRHGYPGWDPVKFEIWGRESIEDGPDGATGYNIRKNSQDPGFEEEALSRGWKKVGNGWFIYPRPRSNPQITSCELTERDGSFKPRYILFRVMSTSTPDVVPVPDDRYYGDDGGYNVFDGINDKNRGCNIGDLYFTDDKPAYILE